MSRDRYFILGPVIIALAFTLPFRWMTVIQVIAGIFYFCLGFLQRDLDEDDAQRKLEEKK